MSILITAANSAQAYQLKNLLPAGDEIVLGDYLDIPDLMVKSGRMIKTPNPNGPSFAHQMLTLCLDKGITDVYALRRSELLPLAEARQLFTEFDIALHIPEKETIENDARAENFAGSIIITDNGVFKVNDLSHQQIFTAD